MINIDENYPVPGDGIAARGCTHTIRREEQRPYGGLAVDAFNQAPTVAICFFFLASRNNN
jgi:hypothetical protein